MSIKIISDGTYKRTKKLLHNLRHVSIPIILSKYGQMGVDALSYNTPVDTSETANSWNYEINVEENRYEIIWTNDKVTPEGTPIVLLLEYGHATKNGGYIEGHEFIDDAIKPVFDDMVETLWFEITKERL